MSIFVVTGKPRNGKTYFLASRVPDWLYEYVLEQGRAKVKREDRFPLTDDFPVGCLYSNVALKLGKGALKSYPERIVGDLHNPDDLKNPTKLVFYWTNLYEWNLMTRRGRILCDEGQRYFNARQWAQLSPETELKLQQHGKEDLDVWLTTQHISRLDVALRQLAEYIAIVRMTFGNPNNKWTLLPRRCEVAWLYLEDVEKYEKQLTVVDPKTGEFMEPKIEPVETLSFWIRKKYYNIYDTRQKIGRSKPMPLRHLETFCENPMCPQHGELYGKPKILHA